MSGRAATQRLQPELPRRTDMPAGKITDRAASRVRKDDDRKFKSFRAMYGHHSNAFRALLDDWLRARRYRHYGAGDPDIEVTGTLQVTHSNLVSIEDNPRFRTANPLPILSTVKRKVSKARHTQAALAQAPKTWPIPTCIQRHRANVSWRRRTTMALRARWEDAAPAAL